MKLISCLFALFCVLSFASDPGVNAVTPSITAVLTSQRDDDTNYRPNPSTLSSIAEGVRALQADVTALKAMIEAKNKPQDPTVKAFCQRHQISRTLYLHMRKRGEGPVEARVGPRIIITPKAEAEWVRARQKAAAEKLAKRQAASDAELAELMRNLPA